MKVSMMLLLYLHWTRRSATVGLRQASDPTTDSDTCTRSQSTRRALAWPVKVHKEERELLRSVLDRIQRKHLYPAFRDIIASKDHWKSQHGKELRSQSMGCQRKQPVHATRNEDSALSRRNVW